MNQQVIDCSMSSPEIVANIIRVCESDPGYLYTCLTVNNVFYSEARRKLWNGCGSWYQLGPDGHITPDIKDFVKIIQQDIGRAQVYADVIQTLTFDDEGETGDFREESTYHQELSQVKFPKLRVVSFDESEKPKLLNTGCIMMHYMQPNVQHFRCARGAYINDTFIVALVGRCPQLTSLHLSNIQDIDVSATAFKYFVDEAKFLNALTLEDNIGDMWTSGKMFEVLVRHRKLEYLSVPAISIDWIAAIESPESERPVFPRLKSLSTALSDEGLALLAKHTRHLTLLSITQSSILSHHMFRSASALTKLRDLSIQLNEESSVHGSDVLLVAQKCPHLKTLKCGESGKPLGIDINDRVMEEIARCLPNIEELCLVFDKPQYLGWQTILSLANHCRRLTDLQLTCDISWTEVLESSQDIAFAELQWIKVQFDEDARILQQFPGDTERIGRCGARISRISPMLKGIIIEGGDAVDQEIESTVDEIRTQQEDMS